MIHDVRCSIIVGRCNCGAENADDLAALRSKYASAVRTLQKIGAMGNAEAETDAAHDARTTLTQLGEPVKTEDNPNA